MKYGQVPNSEIFARVVPAVNVEGIVADIIADVRANGDKAVLNYNLKFDKANLDTLLVSQEEIDEAFETVEPKFLSVLEQAAENIRNFHSKQVRNSFVIADKPGIILGQKVTPIEKVGVYVPGGTAAYPSTVLMDTIPAKIAGCPTIVMVTPPGADGKINPVILAAAKIAGVDMIFKVGGAQAVAALAYGTESIPKVDKIVGPGNAFVAEAKKQVFGQVSIDMIAGPSEILVIADGKSNPVHVAADLLSQAEHGIDSQVLLVCKSMETAQKVEAEVERQLALLPRKDIAALALEHSKTIVVHDDNEMMDITNRYAPEHLIIETANYMELAQKVVNAGSVFLGSLTPESAGDYASGTNHTLPTNGYAVAYSGVNLDSFCRKITFQHIQSEGVRNIGRAVELMADAEGLDAHRNAMTLRIKSL